MELGTWSLYCVAITKRFLFIGGGSGGHIYPLIAVARTLPDAEIRFVCSDKPEHLEFLQKEGLTPATLPTPHGLFGLFAFCKSYIMARKMLREFRPNAIFSKGGALSIAPCLAAKHLHIPIVLHESDAVMGRANRVIAKWAAVVCLGMKVESHESREGSTLTTRNSRLMTGNPVRPEITKGSRDRGLSITGFDGTKPILFILGGSQGARALNEWIEKHLAELLTIADVIHLTGKGKQTMSSRKGYYASAFAFSELPHLYAVTSLAISRAGSGTIAELAANGIPSILVPLRGLAQDHQEANARAAEKDGGCMVVEQDVIEEKLLPAISVTLAQSEQRETMRAKIRTLHHPEAAKTIATMLQKAGENHLPTPSHLA